MTSPVDPATDIASIKTRLREQAHAARNALPQKDELSRKICESFMALPAYAAAKTVMFYVDVRSEVRTRHTLPDALASGKRIVVPYCVDNELELFLLESMDELATGMYKILEPRADLRELPSKKVPIEELDLIMVPGVAFDRRGGRMGHGKGYYDRLLEHARLDTPLIALAFECQMFPEVPTAAHDIFMDAIITEAAVYPGIGRKTTGA
ncbi:5-formyltetrahydrofolate cyclo-ligase [Tuwongella immobilis]|uniref:5-formyltetrahydrofolate cyclo-ligase n=1 Tax=Tuwongella immobilis TaxID=692036 RepID=A0A6C2YM51_9BACT|nr:5-formyltetrahydrofolate cyclo-ligase [Tuwongella immobilis]VIP02391.1 5-formyltetrahydrofolate cyclo-ligase : 5-formyltetrahydrofolate cyclo-ligase OS=Rhodopirellula europaea SH398 GN=RESH_04932 PE=3 SV=1: 5-FTHF_cyc-lig [Tuwongella immobilis]VTS01259.1 5-formyltetrahydrofolate cyclo-ligase : 5-formyltetrahydrofolate cyclo-ligase OS=Rhodopirellula europaea SH398 GN=RESH_04932 PE=3 SV=1: 5-FTHF_cyc-lig [Tuwongella immobilis]